MTSSTVPLRSSSTNPPVRSLKMRTGSCSGPFSTIFTFRATSPSGPAAIHRWPSKAVQSTWSASVWQRVVGEGITFFMVELYPGKTNRVQIDSLSLFLRAKATQESKPEIPPGVQRSARLSPEVFLMPEIVSADSQPSATMGRSWLENTTDQRKSARIACWNSETLSIGGGGLQKPLRTRRLLLNGVQKQADDCRVKSQCRVAIIRLQFRIQQTSAPYG